MPRCVNCKALLYPSFFAIDPDQVPELCIFCKRGTDTITYGEFGTEVYNKKIAIKEYEVFLKMISEKESIKDILDSTSKNPHDIVKGVVQ